LEFGTFILEFDFEMEIASRDFGWAFGGRSEKVLATVY
jgi:hypothetical protein